MYLSKREKNFKKYVPLANQIPFSSLALGEQQWYLTTKESKTALCSMSIARHGVQYCVGVKPNLTAFIVFASDIKPAKLSLQKVT